MSKKIGILTSGGDCAGLNAVLRASSLRSFSYGWEVLGIKEGTTGLHRRPIDYVRFNPNMLGGSFIKSGGTILGSTNRLNPYSYPVNGVLKDITNDIIDGYHQLKLNALIVIGGDGSLKMCKHYASKGNWNLVAIPKTIDNDLYCTDKSIGFNTAVEIATKSIDMLHSTAASHNRIIIIEVMGRNAGHIALNSGIAGGAHVILIPEIDYNINSVINYIIKKKKIGFKYFIVVVSEALKIDNDNISSVKLKNKKFKFGGVSSYLASILEERTGIDSRSVVLGHTQRGGEPCSIDRVLASSLGVKAVDLIYNNQFNRMVTMINGKITDVSIDNAISKYNSVSLNSDLIQTARGVGICLGDN